MNILLWVLQIVLAILFLFHGGALLYPPAAMKSQFDALFSQFPNGFQLLIGVAEVAAGLGLILPWATGILPKLTAWAAIGLLIIMLGAMVAHAQRGELAQAASNGVIVLLIAWVAWGRWR